MPRNNSRSATDRYELHETSGYSMLGVGPTHHPPLSDTLVITVRHRSGYDGRSILASRAQVRELVDWLTRWLEHGWPGVPRAEGPTSVDVIEHFRDVAARERIAADRVRCEAGRQVDAALALIPAGRRSVDLETAPTPRWPAGRWRRSAGPAPPGSSRLGTPTVGRIEDTEVAGA